MEEADEAQRNLLPPRTPRSNDHQTGSTTNFEVDDSATGDVIVVETTSRWRRWISDHAILVKQLLFWIITVLFTALVAAVVLIYHGKGVITSAEKDTLNILLIILILMLDLSFFESFKELARALSGRLMLLSGPSKAEQKLIEQFDSLLNVARLIRVASHPLLKIFCISWLSINLAAQVLSALISLEVPIDDGNNYNTTYMRTDTVRTSDLSCYSYNKSCNHNAVIAHTLAHSYGETILAATCSEYQQAEDIIEVKYDYPYFCRNHSLPEFAYRFREYNPNDTQKAYPRFTNRTITVSSGGCIQHEQIGDIVEVNGMSKITYNAGPTNDTISIPSAKLDREGTTYIYRGHSPPPNNTNYACGPRCLKIWAYKNVGGTDGPMFYECPITVSPMNNGSREDHEIPDRVARNAIASIGLSGQWAGTF